MIIKPTDKLYAPDGKLFIFTGGLKRSDFDGKDINDEREGGHDMYLYQKPKDYDPAINKLDGVIAPIPDTPYCTEDLIDLTVEEKTDIAAQAVINHDNTQRQERENLFNSREYRILQGKVQADEEDKSLLLARRAEIRAEFPYSGEGE